MLKIKDNIDLKELEKFGFKRKISTINENGMCPTIYEEFNIPRGTIIYEYNEIIIYKRILYDCDQICTYSSIIYDLIKADLVEKVEE